ncbi:helix-turn-helix domain-containing protein [Haliscomenobacter hydrossis]|uniref:Transcriptional regulator, AraC family n=1 Tax=Haliscomenobacter hydrossis (strain ATCC 27775 / DSM 1100 / LMG 10767 / O) TaxID=760192 RepID=F4KXL1_HALH1|nr:helix-turn-helix domain-containing protein [Haliscomenobacter hydrossis]AEE50382.1 transcriptional regulator, AraC family [Haliscomenobacter hydrossis DSM 1100]
MVIKYKKPSPFLSPFVAHFWEKHSPENQQIGYETETVLPENYLNLTFSLGSAYFRSLEEKSPFAALNSPQLETLHTGHNFYKHQANNHIFGIKFLPGGLYPFVHLDFMDLINVSLEMDQIFGAEANLLAEELYQLPDFEGRIERVERFLSKQLIERRLQKFRFIQAGTQLLERQHPDAGIASLAEELNTNYKTLSRAFYEVIGISPKHFAQIQRFEHALELLFLKPEWSCTEIGYHLGYYDQAHFIREFKRFAHQTPSAYRESTGKVETVEQHKDFQQFLSLEHLLHYEVKVY